MHQRRLTGTILVVAFFSLALCGAGLFALHAEHGAHVAGCPFTATLDTSCPLSTVSQLSPFTAVLNSLPVNPTLASLLMVLSGLIAAITTTALTPVLHASTRKPLRDAAIWRPLQIAFARGILNPKPY